jgi:hypothetical protein
VAVLTEEHLREGIEAAVLDALGREKVLSDLHWERCDCESSYETYLVNLRFAGEPELRVFLKDYGSLRRPKEDLEARREREVFVYSRLLPAAGVGTARCYGSVRDPSPGRYWLFLEFVEGTPLRYLDFEHWPGAAGWLGRLQGHFARCADELRNANILLEHDRRFFTATGERALRAVEQIVPPLARGLEAVLAGYDRLAETMSNQPKTLVHGAYRPQQILVDLNRHPSRYCPVDWELAAIGCGIHDLAFFADGLEGFRLHQVVEAYREEAGSHGMGVPSPADLGYLVDCFRLHRVFNWLGQSVDRNYSANDVIRLTEMAGSIARTLI